MQMSSSEETVDRIDSMPTSPESEESLNGDESMPREDVFSAPLKKRKLANNYAIATVNQATNSATQLAEDEERPHKKAARKGKNYYIPTKDELLKYVGLTRFFFLLTKS